MNLFEIQARSDGSEFRSRRKWLIVADSLYEAMWLIPQEWRVNAVEVRPAAARGPGRVIGWMTGLTSSGKAGGPEPARPGATDWWKAARGGQTSSGGRPWRGHLSSYSS